MSGGVEEQYLNYRSITRHCVLEEFIHLCIRVVAGRWLGIKEIAGHNIADMESGREQDNCRLKNSPMENGLSVICICTRSEWPLVLY